jgi:hypothetical protein
MTAAGFKIKTDPDFVVPERRFDDEDYFEYRVG